MLTKSPDAHEDGYWAAQSAVEVAAFLGLDPAADNSPDAGYYPPTKVKPRRNPLELMIRVLDAVAEQLREHDERQPRKISPATAKRWAPAEPPELPELMKPDGAGYMPLYCVAQWIAQRGGTRKINPLDEAIWREAYKDLLDHIVSGDVKVVGERPDGISEEISGAHFASCSVNYPFSDPPILGNEFWLVSYPYLDDEYWRGGKDDRLENWRGVRWRRLMVSKADIARWWPFVSINANATLTQADATLSASASLQPQPALAVTPLGTGAPGRPTSMHLVEEEHRARRARGDANSKIGAEAEYLSTWLANAHPTMPRATAKTIRNRLSSEYRRRPPP
jgi:hypothetical protein